MSDFPSRELRDIADTLRGFQDRVTVREERDGADKKYIINGPLDAVLEEIASLFRRYHPLGYGTRLRSMEFSASKYEAIVTRYASCD